AVAVLYPSVLHVVTADRTGIRTLSDLRGRRVAVGSFRGARTEMVVRIVLSEVGLSFDDIEPVWLPRTEMAHAVSRGTIDAACHFGGFALFDAAGKFRPISVSRQVAGHIQEKYPFIRPTVVPGGTYPGQDAVVASISIDMLLVSRRDLGERLVYDVVSVVSDALPILARTNQVLRTVEPRNMPTPPIPLHPGAVRFYREQALLR
ncbi:MAG: TAXI family TRAP transporter solute-binding subunit, partial [Acidobacteria bacterium]